MRKVLLFYLLFSFIFSQDEYNLNTCYADISPDAEVLGNEKGIFLYKSQILNSYPNPFNSSTIMEFEVKELSNVLLEVYSINSNKISNLSEKIYAGGSCSATWRTDHHPRSAMPGD